MCICAKHGSVYASTEAIDYLALDEIGDLGSMTIEHAGKMANT